ncbi:hypothetical protein DEJ48_32930 [Streptomyces venezuelae]|uniref:Uncharacterized protein n=1 Tax=Streptomyces venezuelae TaxID=54571 RepID=A0A5P2C5M3_STRVZ|nr:hypothetical protein [Streptomyces venezuelae]QES37580.1 hypothetical protein DEJ48_32930 [Streptomyces venezuelae]
MAGRAGTPFRENVITPGRTGCTDSETEAFHDPHSHPAPPRHRRGRRVAADRGGGGATGTFHFVHLDRPGGEGGWAKGRVDCLMTGGKVATATGIITEGNFKKMKGKRVGFTVDDRGRNDRVGYSWAAYGATQGQPDTLALCASSAPYEKVRKGTGDSDVVPWKVPYPEPQEAGNAGN